MRRKIIIREFIIPSFTQIKPMASFSEFCDQARVYIAHRDSPTSNLLSEVMKMNLIKVKDHFFNLIPDNKNLLHFMHRCYGLR